MSGTSRPRSANVFIIPGRPEEVVGVEVGQEDVLDVRQPDRAQQLALRALAAVDQHAVAAAPHQQAGRRALDGRHRAGRAEEQDGEVHGRLSSLTAPRDNRAVPDPPSENVRLLLRVYGVWHSGDLPRILEFLDPEFEWVNPDYAVDPGIRRGHDGFALVMRNLEATFAHQDHVLGEYEELGEGRVLWHTIFHARGHSGAAIDVPEQHLWTLRDGKILRLQWFHDAEEARRAADAADREVEESLDERLRAGYAAFNDGRVSGILAELEPDVEMVVSMGGPEGTTRVPRARRHGEWAREMGDVWRDIKFEPLEVEVDPAGRRALVVVRVSTRGRASDMGLEGMEAHVVTLGPDREGHATGGVHRSGPGAGRLRGPCPGSMMSHERA